MLTEDPEIQQTLFAESQGISVMPDGSRNVLIFRMDDLGQTSNPPDLESYHGTSC